MSASTTISEHTKVTVGLLITLVGAVVWLVTLSNKVEAHGKYIDSRGEVRKQYDEKLEKLQSDVTGLRESFIEFRTDWKAHKEFIERRLGRSGR